MTTPTLSESLEAAYDKVAAATPEPPTPVVPDPSPEAADSLPTAPDAGQDKTTGEPGATTSAIRDALGRFASKGESAPAAPDAAKAADTSTAPAVADAPTPAPADAAATPAATDPFTEAPQSWAVEQRTHWEKVPPEVRGYLHQREGELQQGFQKVAQRGNVAEAVLGEFAPYAEVLQAEGATPITAMRTLLQTAHALRTGGTEYRKAIIMSLAQQYGVDLGSEYNPALAQAQAEAQALSTEKMYGQTINRVAEENQVRQQFDAFANDPRNEFFGTVRGIMGNLITAGVAQDLSTAYQMALGMHPEVRQELMGREMQAREAAQRKAAVASMSVSGSPSGAAAPSKDSHSSLRDTIAAQMANVQL